MIQIRKSGERGHFHHGWLDTFHTFSFSEYHDPRHMGFRTLRVMNEDRVAPGEGFGMHGHRDMEILTCVLSGALEHKDSLGNGEILRPGEFQRMSAGSGIRHSEFNPSSTEPVHLYQIWILPERRGLTPSYEQKRFDDIPTSGAWRVVASDDARDGSLKISQDARVYRATLPAGGSSTYEIPPQRHAWLQVMSGRVTLGGQTLTAGDGAALSDEQKVELTAAETADLLLFDLA